MTMDDGNQNQNPTEKPNLKRCDSLDVESGKLGHENHQHQKNDGWSVILQLAFQSLGVVYGDIGTSPLYMYPSVFPNGIEHPDDILGVLSIIIYTITLLPVVKYVFIVLQANDNGDGGTFALYSLICRHVKVGLIPNAQMEDHNVSTYKLKLPDSKTETATKLQKSMENSYFGKYFLLFATMLGTSMVIGDGILTPCISVLSAVGGIKEATTAMTEIRIVWISVVILILLFLVQRFGTDKVGYTFGPIICIWFFLIAAVGLFNFFKHDPTILKCLNPMYIVNYFRRNKKQAWISLGGIVMCITGTEALFADLGHFSVRSIQISMCGVVYPSIIFQYMGQSAYLRKHSESVADAFYKAIPVPIYWPMFVAAVLAAVIASQALISGAFAIIQQSLCLGCFPRVRVVHTSAKYQGQVYIPEVNYLLMLACVLVTLGFKNTVTIGNAYGIAVVFVMALTSAFLVLIMIMIWRTNILLILCYIFTIGVVELIYLSSVLYKFDQGGYLPLAFSFVLMFIMYTWNYAFRKKYHFELEKKISSEEVKELISDTKSLRVPRLAIFYSELVHGIPPIFRHYVANVPAIHSVLVFVSVKSLPVSKVKNEERFLFRRVQPSDLHVYRCVVRYGYKDVCCEEEPFETLMIEKLKHYINEDSLMNKNVENETDEVQNGEMVVFDQACEAGVVHLVGEHEVVAGKGAGIGKKVLINYAYNFLKKNLVQSNKMFHIPHEKMLKVGMVYDL